MGRPRADLGPGADDRIVAMMARGLGPDAIAAELGASRATVARRMKDLRAGVPAVRGMKRKAAAARAAAPPAPPAAKASADAPSAPVVRTVPPKLETNDARALARAEMLAAAAADEATLEQTPLEQIAEWLKMAREEVELARVGDDPDTLQKMMRIASTLLTLQQKHTPIAPPDPNQNPDFIAAALRVRERWHDLANKAALARAFIAMAETIKRRYGK